MNFSRIAKQLTEGESLDAAAAASEKAKNASLGVREVSDRAKARQKAGMASQQQTTQKSDISYASEEARIQRETEKMLHNEKSDWRKDLNEARGPDETGNHPFVDVMPSMNQKEKEAKKQMKAVAVAQDDGHQAGEGDTGMKEEVEVLNELNRLEKEQGKKSGGSDNAAYRIVAKQMRDMQGTPKGQQKKVKGKKPPVAGEYGAPKSPAQKLSLKKRKAQDFKDQQTSRFD